MEYFRLELFYLMIVEYVTLMHGRLKSRFTGSSQIRRPCRIFQQSDYVQGECFTTMYGNEQIIQSYLILFIFK
jgi:hypothetical protein